MPAAHASNRALERALTAFGGQSAMARALGVSQAAVWKWSKRGKSLPAEHVLAVERETGISRHDLRPDLYPVEVPGPDRAGGPDQLEPAA